MDDRNAQPACGIQASDIGELLTSYTPADDIPLEDDGLEEILPYDPGEKDDGDLHGAGLEAVASSFFAVCGLDYEKLEARLREPGEEEDEEDPSIRGIYARRAVDCDRSIRDPYLETMTPSFERYGVDNEDNPLPSLMEYGALQRAALENIFYGVDLYDFSTEEELEGPDEDEPEEEEGAEIIPLRKEEEQEAA